MKKKNVARKVRQAVNRMMAGNIEKSRVALLESMNEMPLRLRLKFCWRLLRGRIDAAEWHVRF